MTTRRRPGTTSPETKSLPSSAAFTRALPAYATNHGVSVLKLYLVVILAVGILILFFSLPSSSSFGYSSPGAVPWSSHPAESNAYSSPSSVSSSSIVTLETFARPNDYPPTPGFFDHLASKRCAYHRVESTKDDGGASPPPPPRNAPEAAAAAAAETVTEVIIGHSLPNSTICRQCVKKNNCAGCPNQCRCFCESLCQDSVRYDAKKFVSKRLTVMPPVGTRTNKLFDNGKRLIPKIIHQTYYEEITPERYPAFHEFVTSWKESGWEYRFYNNSQAEEFLSFHFPPEVRQAFESLNYGAFKADLFRYCALLIHGGVYADVDINCTSDLDLAIPPDVGFAVPIEQRGIGVPRSFLWNGFLAAAPAHPYLAMAIEMSVNNIRNRYNTIDMADRLCPNPNLGNVWRWDMLSVTGPFLLGMAVNTVHDETSVQAPFASGTLDRPKNRGLNGYGRTLILNKVRIMTSPNRIKPKAIFDNDNTGTIWAQSDLKTTEDKKKHYSKASMADVYVDNVSSDEVIRILVHDKN